MPPTIDIKLGYGGGAKINGAPVLLTGGSLTRSLAVPKIEPFGMPADDSSRSAVQIGYGVWSYSGSISFDWTVSAVTALITNTFLVRNKVFDVILSDGNKTYTVSNCKFSSLSISAAANSLVTGSMEFQTCEDFTEAGTVSHIFDQSTNMLVKYWQTGNTGVESFTLTLTQALTPVYLNYASGSSTQRTNPQYLRAGMWEVNLDVTAFTGWLALKAVNVGPKLLTITHGSFETEGFSYGGVSETGAHNYSFKSSTLTDSSTEFFTIT